MKKRRSKSGNTLWMVTAILIAVFIAGLFYLQKQQNVTHKNKTVTAIKSESKAKPKFDFYTVLPQSTPQNSPAVNATNIPLPSNSTNSTDKYLLQVGAVKAFSDADRLKAQLILQGFNVNIQKIKVGDTIWNRINLGPYNSLSAAQNDQSSLRKLKINSILLKIKL